MFFGRDTGNGSSDVKMLIAIGYLSKEIIEFVMYA